MKSEITLIEFEKLMLEALGTNISIDDEEFGFSMYSYRGTIFDLFIIMEHLAIKKRLIDKNIEVTRSSWGSSISNLVECSTSNFTELEIERIYQTLNILIIRGIISPGAYGNYGSRLPFIHVTEHGKQCIKENKILPYDSLQYLEQYKSIKNIDNWIIYYLEQSLECFNYGLADSSMIMLGLASEKLVNELLDSFTNYLEKKNTNLFNKFTIENNKKKFISQKLSMYFKFIDDNKLKKSINKEADTFLDDNMMDTIINIIRVSRNDVSHPNKIKTDRTKVFMLLVSFEDICNRIYKYINYYNMVN